MATLNLGRIKPVFKGAYSGGTAYVIDDIVTHGNESFICIQAHGAGTQAVTVTAYWSVMASTGTDLTTTLTTAGDIVYKGASALTRLAKGTTLQTLKMNAGATAPEWSTVSAGGVVQVKTAHLSTNVSVSGVTNTGYTQLPTATWSLNFTPTSASNKVMLFVQANISDMTSASNRTRISLWRDSTIVAGTTTTLGSKLYAFGGAYSNSDREIRPAILMHLDNPSTTSQVNYNFKMNTDGSAGGNIAYVNRSQAFLDDGGQPVMTSNITAFEIDSGVL